MGLASRETAVGRFQNIEGEELEQELGRIDENEEKLMMSDESSASATGFAS